MIDLKPETYQQNNSIWSEALITSTKYFAMKNKSLFYAFSFAWKQIYYSSNCVRFKDLKRVATVIRVESQIKKILNS